MTGIARASRVDVGGVVELHAYIGKHIRAHRERRKITQEDLAQAVGLTRTSITNIEGGHQRLQLDDLYLIAKCLDVDPRTMLPAPGANLERELRLLKIADLKAELAQLEREEAETF